MDSTEGNSDDALEKLEKLRLLGLGQLPEPEPPVGEDLSEVDRMMAHIEANAEHIDRLCREMSAIELPEFTLIELPEFRVEPVVFKPIELPVFYAEIPEFYPMLPPQGKTN